MSARTPMKTRGFTLIELLAVMVIIGLLVTALVSGGLLSFLSRGEEAVTQKILLDLQGTLDEVERDLGIYPSGSWDKFRVFARQNARKLHGVDSRRLEGGSPENSGSEVLFLLFEAYGVSPGVDEEYIGDTDEDGYYEYLDAWGHPLAYICNLSDDGSTTVLAPSPEGESEQLEPVRVVPLLSQKIHKGRPRGSYQILSGGADGIFDEEGGMVFVVKD